MRAADKLIREMDEKGLFTKQAQPHVADSATSLQPADEGFTLSEDAQPVEEEAFTLGDEEQQPPGKVSQMKPPKPIKLTNVVKEEQPPRQIAEVNQPTKLTEIEKDEASELAAAVSLRALLLMENGHLSERPSYFLPLSSRN